MKECKCSGNNSLRPAIGAFYCDCGGKLNDAQFKHRVVRRLNELDDANSRAIQALQTLGADRCDCCGMWSKDFWALYDHCWCYQCLKNNHDGPIPDDESEEITNEMAGSIARYLSGKGHRKFHGIILEAYQLYSRRVA